ncbi:MAG: RNA polymerase II C-terminal domain kinase beta subunit [Phylliscum demangeonii]|nr:MAG: RNA polymerase II C-terminal domain kinase beta subunit [Phylliscum demangeonii]
MVPETLMARPSSATAHVGPHPSYIQVAKPYVFEQKVQRCLHSSRIGPVKEDSLRLQGVAWIDGVRRALHLPVRTFDTAVVYYHKFRLSHPDHEYYYYDVAGAALFAACKVEDTLKKSKDILCAAYNLKLAPADQLSTDNSIFEAHSRTIIGLERLMLEASGFDFRNRYPQKVLMKLIKQHQVHKSAIGRTAFEISVDLYRTIAPLKQTSSTMALACLDLAARIHCSSLEKLSAPTKFDYWRWGSGRDEVMETLLDILDLYTHHRNYGSVAQRHPLDAFLAIRIQLNHEADARHYPRYTQSTEHDDTASPKKRKRAATTNGTGHAHAHDGRHENQRPADMDENRGRRRDRARGRGRGRNAPDHASPPHGRRDTQPHPERAMGLQQSPVPPPSLHSPNALAPPSSSSHAGHRARRDGGRDRTVRFMLEPGRARQELAVVADYFAVLEEEYEVEVEVEAEGEGEVDGDGDGEGEGQVGDMGADDVHA